MIPGSANPLLLATAAPTGYNIERSLRFNSSDSAYCSRVPSTAGNRKTWTWAGWVKRSKLGAEYELFFSARAGTSSSRDYLAFQNDLLALACYNSAGTTITANIQTTAVFRDPGAWFHVVLAVDTTQSTAANRIRMYVNGVEITAFSLASYPSQNTDLSYNDTQPHTIGQGAAGTAFGFNGYLADVFFVDGQQLTPSSFTEVDATTGQLIPKAYTGSYGTNGFHLDFSDNSAATATTLGADSSGNGNNWTPNNLSINDFFYGDFDGTNNDYLRKSGSGVLDSNGTVTIECHFFPRTSSTIGLFDGGPNQTNIIRNHPSNAIEDQNGPSVTFSASANQWHHIAVTVSSGILTVYLNGTQTGTANIGTYDGGSNFDIGTINAGSAGKFNGFIRNFRVTKSIVYTSNFTPPPVSSQLTAITGTSLLTLVNNFADGSTNGYTLTNNGVTAITPQSDSLVDTPTSYGTDAGIGGEVRGNYCTWNPLYNASQFTLSNGNLDWTRSSGDGISFGTIGMSSGKWYWELTLNRVAQMMIGIADATISTGTYLGNNATAYVYLSDARKGNNSAYSSYGATYTNGDVIGVAFDADNGTIAFYKNGAAQGTAYSSIPARTYFPATSSFNNDTGGVNANFGQRPFAYTAPSGFKALCTANLPDPVVAKPSTVMDVKLWTGNSGTQNITGLAFSPDLAWVKGRTGILNHVLSDTIRGANLKLASNTTGAETGTDNGTISAFNSDGITVAMGTGTYPGYETNLSTYPYVGWFWDAGSSTVTNTAGSIAGTVSVRANPSAGFSVVTYSGGATNATVGHGLNVAPQFIIAKSRGSGVAGARWDVYHASLGRSKYLYLDGTDAAGTDTNHWGTADPTSSVFGLATAGYYNNTGNMVAYCFAPVAGYSSGFSYTGNGSTDGSFVYLGFRPRLILLKCSSATGNWTLLDTAREGYNVDNDPLYPNLSNAEGTTDLLDITSNGFKLRTTDASVNSSGATYVGYAWAEAPFAYSRAR